MWERRQHETEINKYNLMECMNVIIKLNAVRRWQNIFYQWAPRKSNGRKIISRSLENDVFSPSRESVSKGDIESTDSRNIKLRLLLKHHQKFMHYNLSLIAMLFWWFSIYLCDVDFNGEQLFDTTIIARKFMFDMSWCFFVALVWWGGVHKSRLSTCFWCFMIAKSL